MQSYVPAYLRSKNRGVVYQLLLQYHSLSKADIAKLSNLTFPTVKKVIEDFLQLGLVSEGDSLITSETGLGRKSQMIKLNENSYGTVGIFFEGNLLHIGLVNLCHEIIDQIYYPLQKDPSQPEEYEQISEKMADELRKLADDEDVKAVVFRVNSPGGSAYISEQIWKAVTELKEEKPIVVSMGDYAASGGYYISCAANKIVAEKTTLTGSIGVFGVVRNMAGTAQKLGVKTDIVKTNTYADLGDMTRPMREDEKALIQHGVERTYDLFLTRCSDGRGMSKDSIDHIGQGRVWTGEQALERGLVDKLGGLDVAIEEAASLAGITDYSVTKANTKKDFFTEYMEKALGEAKVSVVKSVLGEDFSIYSTLQQMKGNTGIQTRMPYLIQGL